jgi:hypothetical protein
MKNASSDGRNENTKLRALLLLPLFVLPVILDATPSAAATPSVTASNYPIVSIQGIQALSSLINQTASNLKTQFLGPDLSIAVVKAFSVVRADPAFNSSVSKYGVQGFAWGLDYKMDNYSSVVANFMFTGIVGNVHLTTSWNIPLSNYADSGAVTTSSPIVTDSAETSGNWGGYTYTWTSAATTEIVEALSQNATTAALVKPPSGQISSHVPQMTSAWVGLTTSANGGDIIQTGYSNDATTNNGTTDYPIWYEFFCSCADNIGQTMYSGTSYAKAGDVLYLDATWDGSPTNKAAFEVCDRNDSNTCYTKLYTTGISVTPYYAQYIAEAPYYTETNGTQVTTQLAKFDHDGTKFGILFNHNEICDSSSCNTPGNLYQYNTILLEQNYAQANTGLKSNDYSSNTLDVTWVTSAFTPAYICSSFTLDCHGV